MTNEKIARINELYKKSKAEGLSEEEKKEQAGVRSGESDCFDRDGAFHGTGWRV